MGSVRLDHCDSSVFVYPQRPKPLGAIFQPELAAQAIYWATQRAKRELFVGWESIRTIEGNKLAPWYGDQVLARIGFDHQQRDEPTEPNRQDNLWQPVPGDHGAHGPFDDQASRFSWQLWASLHRWQLASVLAAMAGLAAGWTWTAARRCLPRLAANR